MKVIDLLNKIANGEELPKKVKYIGTIFENKNEDLLNNINCSLFEHSGDGYEKLLPMLNDEVEILEEETTVSEEQVLFNNLTTIDQEYVIRIMKMLQQPIDYLKSKGDE